MSGTALSTLTSRLMGLVAALNGVPSSAQYQQCVEDAVADFSLRKPNRKVTSIAVVSGTATYALPDDFVREIDFESLLTDDRLMITATGLIPLDSDFDEVYTYAGGVLTIYPTPAYTSTRDLTYAAGHVLNSSAAYPDLSATDAAIVMLYAQALVFGLQAGVATAGGWKYQIGDEMVDKSKHADVLRGQADYFQKRYETALAQSIGAYGARGWVSETR